MPAPGSKLALDRARLVLGLPSSANAEEARVAFRAAAKRAHPDRPGGDAERFREIVAAYRALQTAPQLPARIVVPPAAFVEISARIALEGGEAEAFLSDGRRLRTRIAAGSRHGDRLRIAGVRVTVRIVSDEALQVRGSDLWITACVASYLLDDGGRASVETPLGRKVLWISGKAAERRLIRLEGEGLPARGRHPLGSLFIRLAPETGVQEGPARAKLREFAAAWAA
ncbi:MAG: DnaJ domain-containing protein [Caulobacterales bacterium]